MTPEREREALRLFAQALDIDGNQRESWLHERIADDPELRQRVASLLSADEYVSEHETPGSDPVVLPPDSIGVYRLEALIGAGGMGSVYRAVRTDGLFDQTVAVKVMRPHVGGVDLAPLIDAERRTLARMDHDGIARILDGGQTANGLPYLIMDYVDGAPLDLAADLSGMDGAGRVALIRQVASALSHAHQSGIVHCDVKPANVLVTQEGKVKLIDFGIARLPEVEAVEGLDGLTRAYASPERCRREPARLADDVYALAVTLYQLLARGLPWVDPERADPNAPPTPLVVTPDLMRDLRNPNDLVAILDKALGPAGDDRYRSVEAFDDDLARWQGLHPVSAMPPRPGYVLRKLTQRRPGATSVAVAGLVTLIAALAVITGLYLSAEAARRSADARFTELRSLAKFMIFDLNTDLEQVPGATPARLAMSEQAQTYLDALGQTAQGNADLTRDVATGLLRLAEVQGVPSRPNLGLSGAAMANLDRSIGLFDGLIAASPDDTTLRVGRAQALYYLAVARGSYDQDTATQLTLARRAEADALAAVPTATGQERGALNALLVGARMSVSDAMQSDGDVDGALQLRLSEEARILGLSEADQVGLDFDYETGRIAALVGDSHYWLGQTELSAAAYARAADRFRSGLADDPLNRRLLTGLHYATYSRSAILADLGDPAGGLAAAEESATVAQRLLDWDPTDRLARQLMDASQGQIALMLRANGRLSQALALVDRQIETYRAYAAANPDDEQAARQVAVPMRGRAEIVFALQGKEAGCVAYADAKSSWEGLPNLTAFDRDNDLAVIIAAMDQNECG